MFFCRLIVSRRVSYVEQEHVFTPAFSGLRVARSSVFCVLFCRLLFVFFLLVIALSVFYRFDYPVCYLRIFLNG
jgi:hypothetical protein